MDLNLSAKIEGLLFLKSEPFSKKDIAHILKEEESNIEEALTLLKRSYAERGIRLIIKNDEVTLGTAPELAPLF